jgi:hypothetical protein
MAIHLPQLILTSSTTILAREEEASEEGRLECSSLVTSKYRDSSYTS